MHQLLPKGALSVAIASFVGAQSAYALCSCNDRNGKKVELGQVARLTVDGRSYLAECVMNLNVTSWKKVGDSCPQAANHAVKQSLWTDTDFF